MLSRLTSTLSEVKLRKAGRHQPHQAVEDDFQHRQALVGDQRRIDDGADAGLVLQLVVIDVEAQEAVDFVLIEDALGRAAASRAASASDCAVRPRPAGQPSDSRLSARLCRCRRP